MNTKAFFVVYNPVAGRGLARRRVAAVQEWLEARGATLHVQATNARGDGIRLAAEAARDGWPVVVAVGGDGTINEVVNGLLRAEDEGATLPTFGIVPAGSGNDFVKVLGLYRQPLAHVMNVLWQGQPRLVDVGRANGRYFLNGLGWGFDGFVAQEVYRVQWLRGFAAYVWAVLKVLPRYPTARLHMMLDDRPPLVREMTMVAVTNGPCYGGGFWICPHAQVDDGWLDVAIADAMRPWELLPLLPRVMRGTHVNHPRVAFDKARQVVLQSERPLPSQVDGELLGTDLRELRVQIFPQRLAVLAQPPGQSTETERVS